MVYHAVEGLLENIARRWVYRDMHCSLGYRTNLVEDREKLLKKLRGITGLMRNLVAVAGVVSKKMRIERV